MGEEGGRRDEGRREEGEEGRRREEGGRREEERREEGEGHMMMVNDSGFG